MVHHASFRKNNTARRREVSGGDRRPYAGGALPTIALAVAGVALGTHLWAPSWTGGAALAHGNLPPGPISERHDLMEGMGKNAKTIGAAAKSGQPGSIVQPARAIAGSASRIPGLFPPGSTHPESRAKPEIWDKFPLFEHGAETLETGATALAEAAVKGGDVSAEVRVVMRACKSCHDEFRVPEDDEN